jgi:hypothetical protein
MKAILGFIRHTLTFGGGYFVSNGLVDQIDIDTVIGAVVTLIGIVWSIAEKYPREKVQLKLPPLLLPFLLIATVLPPGCVTGPDGTTTIGPEAKALLKGVARGAALIGLSAASVELPFLSPFAPQIAKGINQIFASDETDPKVLGNELKALFARVALDVGQTELDKILMEYVSKELVTQIPAGSPNEVEQYKFNAAIVNSFEL